MSRNEEKEIKVGDRVRVYRKLNIIEEDHNYYQVGASGVVKHLGFGIAYVEFDKGHYLTNENGYSTWLVKARELKIVESALW